MTLDYEMNLLKARALDLVFDGENNPDPDAEAAAAAAAAAAEAARVEAEKKKKPKLDQTTQDYVNSLVAAERRKGEQKNNELITQLETQRNNTATTVAERQALEERIETLRAEYATQEQLTKTSTEKKIKDLEGTVKTKDGEIQVWSKRFQEKVISVDLTQAAVDGKAFNPKQVVTILKPHTRVIEEVGDDGKPTGEFLTRVKLPAKDKDGKPVILELAPTEAVKQLSEMPEEYGNLFISGANGGLGGGSLGRGGAGGTKDKSQLPTSEYVAQRAADRRANIARKTSTK